ncbi:MAG: type 3 dihydrofolate reductase [Methylophagaceae bacterium]
MNISIIVATDEHGLIGRDNNLPWALSADLQYFRRITMGKPLIMGRNTHESIGRALPGRKNIVLTNNADYQLGDCSVVHTIDEAVHACGSAEEVMVMGGASLYKQFLPLANKLYLTLVHANLSGDTWFPDWDKTQWQEISREDHDADNKNNYPYSFISYQRI